ncbi:class I SAM-dependent methyltransferase [Mycobacterium colombiense]|uniref:class I SAM-dependent methyltransferase n=1 Tax=Mycobacterium colombiense TaxID=339268 RepID=UPI00200A3074|nr:class I SAM-dependent methyltransferase [Mycobacterium colombiense]MCK8643384.1 class I SAM-dependent methyltransferase [Mycobacterium colombiense]
MKCRHCGAPADLSFVDLGFAPPSNAYLDATKLSCPEVYYPLRVKVCPQCWLVQTEDYAEAEELFSPDYAYFSSTSSGWLEHAARYARMITERLQLGSDSFVIEVASNDGYLLKNFVAAQIPCLGIEPTASTAAAAEALGIPVRREFFGESLGRRLATEGQQADLIAGNNVYAHVPDINDFTRGLAAALKPEGTVTLEFPHLMPLIERTQFDTIYHEHFSYHSLTTVARIFDAAGLRVWDVEELPTHGGSLRVYGCHTEATIPITDRVDSLLKREDQFGLTRPATYSTFQQRADRVKDDLLAFLIEQKHMGRRVAAYGAAAKGNTLLNYAGVRPDLLPYVCDAAASKQGKFLPGSHIPIYSPKALRENRPDDVVILPWNIAQEVRTQLADLVDNGTRFVTAVPELSIL